MYIGSQQKWGWSVCTRIFLDRQGLICMYVCGLLSQQTLSLAHICNILCSMKRTYPWVLWTQVYIHMTKSTHHTSWDNSIVMTCSSVEWHPCRCPVWTWLHVYRFTTDLAHWRPPHPNHPHPQTKKGVIRVHENICGQANPGYTNLLAKIVHKFASKNSTHFCWPK